MYLIIDTYSSGISILRILLSVLDRHYTQAMASIARKQKSKHYKKNQRKGLKTERQRIIEENKGKEKRKIKRDRSGTTSTKEPFPRE